jgi:GntR family transcriptional regulator, rspAB operon transcriptional repressor
MALAAEVGESIDRRQPVAPQAYLVLRRAITSLELRPLEALSEQEVARQLRVSRTPVREAFIRLAEEGLVEVLPQKGTLVAPIAINAVLEGQFVRESLEVAAARQAAQELDPRLLAALTLNIDQQRVACDQGELERFHALDESLHRTIFIMTRHPVAWRVTKVARGQLDRVRRLSIPDPFWLNLALKQHEQIVESLRAADVDRVERAVREHARAILAIIPDLSGRFPQYFVGADGSRLSQGREASAESPVADLSVPLRAP